MQAFTTLLLTITIVSVIVSPVLAYEEPWVGVKEGDWIEYNVSVTGIGAMPPTHDVRWMRMEILKVQGAAFSMNLTVNYANGTIGSAVWEFNFTEGNVGGWLIVPSNLGFGDTFYDSSIHTGEPVNVTIQSEEKRTVLGSCRTVTCGSDSFRHKEWDRATGVFVSSSEHFENVTNRNGWYIEDLTVNIQPTATNMWSPTVILGLNQTAFYKLAAVIVMMAFLVLSLEMVLVRKRRIKRLKDLL